MTLTATRHTHWETTLFASPEGRSGSARPDAVKLQVTVGDTVATVDATVDDLLAEARSTYERISVRAAYQWALFRRGVIVDIRPQQQRQAEGEVHPDLEPVLIERTVLEWRLDPQGDARLPWVTPDSRVIVLSQESYASSLAAATLHRLGLRHATDVVGGLRAWREAGLPMAKD